MLFSLRVAFCAPAVGFSQGQLSLLAWAGLTRSWLKYQFYLYFALIVCCRSQVIVSTLVQLMVIQHQPLQQAPATDFCTFTCISFHQVEQ